MRSNAVRRKLEQNLPVYGTMLCETRNPAVVQIIANAGYDFVFIDCEHSTYGFDMMADLVQTARLCDVTALVRVPEISYPFIARALDAGAEGIMAPRVETVEQVRDLVDMVHYPPIGRRGLAVARGHNDYGRADARAFARDRNDQNLVIIQIESSLAVDSITELLAEPGVDVAVLGPQDLALSLDTPMLPLEGSLEKAIGVVVEAGAAASIPTGMHIGDVNALRHWRERGMRMIACASDIDMLIDASTKNLEHLLAESVTS